MTPLQGELLQIFKIFANTCDKLGVRYYAFGGTLLGAIRHGGFIPWDDDMDFAMTRVDYDRFISEAQPLMPDYIFLQTVDTDRESWFPFLKIRDSRFTQIEKSYSKVRMNHGPWIDVFPLDEMDCAPSVAKKHDHLCGILYRRIMIHFGLWRPRSFPRVLKKALLCMRWPFWKTAAKKLNLYNKSHFFPSGILTFTWDSHERYNFPKQWFGDVRCVPFEDTIIAVPVGFEALLRHFYGDWQVLPPQEQRVPVHDCFVDLNKSYLEQ